MRCRRCAIISKRITALLEGLGQVFPFDEKSRDYPMMSRSKQETEFVAATAGRDWRLTAQNAVEVIGYETSVFH
jgi:hypothetical protein